ncbi:MAG: pyridoxamine 5'-phosphate oxidase family protein [Clostridia bacterium]|nr:pyridoxamine 5'-phosphate oxidase family protein [Clostridia bacterium]
MRRYRQALSQTECLKILESNTSGVLALYGEDGYPYAVPISYAFMDEKKNKLVFHSAVEGKKLDAIRYCSKASFCVIDRDTVVPETFTTVYRSVIAFGTVRIENNWAKIKPVLHALSEKYAPRVPMEAREKEIAGAEHRTVTIEFAIERMTGKQAKELVEDKQI